MPAYFFDGVNDFIEYTSPDTALAAVPTANRSLIATFRRTITSTWDGLITLQTVAPDSQLSLEVNSSNQFTLQSGAASSSVTTPLVQVGVTYAVCVSKASGSVAPVFYIRELGGPGVVYSGNGDTAIGDASNIGTDGTVQVGRWEATDNTAGYIGVAAVYNYTITATQFATMLTNERTQDLWHLAPSGNPVFFAEYGGGSIDDQSGQILGSTNASGAVPAPEEPMSGWKYDSIARSGLHLPALGQTAHPKFKLRR